jgi:hypothetical protein
LTSLLGLTSLGLSSGCVRKPRRLRAAIAMRTNVFPDSGSV